MPPLARECANRAHCSARLALWPRVDRERGTHTLGESLAVTVESESGCGAAGGEGGDHSSARAAGSSRGSGGARFWRSRRVSSGTGCAQPRAGGGNGADSGGPRTWVRASRTNQSRPKYRLGPSGSLVSGVTATIVHPCSPCAQQPPPPTTRCERLIRDTLCPESPALSPPLPPASQLYSSSPPFTPVVATLPRPAMASPRPPNPNPTPSPPHLVALKVLRATRPALVPADPLLFAAHPRRAAPAGARPSGGGDAGSSAGGGVLSLPAAFGSIYLGCAALAWLSRASEARQGPTLTRQGPTPPQRNLQRCPLPLQRPPPPPPHLLSLLNRPLPSPQSRNAHQPLPPTRRHSLAAPARLGAAARRRPPPRDERRVRRGARVERARGACPRLHGLLWRGGACC